MVKKSKKPAKRSSAKPRKRPIRRVVAARRTLKQAGAAAAALRRLERKAPRLAAAVRTAAGLPAPDADPRQLGMPWAPPPLTEEQRKALRESPRITATMRVARIRAKWWQAAARRADAPDWSRWASRLMDAEAARLLGPMPTTEEASS